MRILSTLTFCLLFISCTLGQGYFVIPKWQSAEQTEFSISKGEKVEMNASSGFIGINAFTTNLQANFPLEYRYFVDGHWGNWESMEAFHEGHTEGRNVFEGHPVFTKVDSVQFKALSNNLNWTIRIFIAGESQNAPEERIAESVPCSQPAYCDRDCWCDTCLSQNSSPTTPTHLIIHHSAGFSAAPDYKQVMTYYWDFHVNTNGWDDIGYNWLIDPNGVIYEARGSNTLGAHFSCMNSNTLGICMIGNYVSQPPSDTAMGSLLALLAYEASTNNIDPDGMSYHSTSQLNLYNISSHRDGNGATAPGSCPKGTVCPGDSLYALLPEIRNTLNAKGCMQGVSVTENEIKEASIYPNPVSEVLYLEMENNASEGVILNSMGQKVMKVPSGTIKIEISHLPEGIYFLEIKGEQREVLRFVKM